MQVENPTPRDKRILEAHRRRYEKGQNYEEIAEAMGKSYDTIRDYFRSEATDRIKQLYDDEEIEFMRIQLLNEVENSTSNAKNHLSRALEHEKAKASDFKSAAKEEQKIIERKIKMLQELDILQKPKERKEVTEQSSNDDVMERMREALKEKQEEEENDDEQVVEA